MAYTAPMSYRTGYKPTNMFKLPGLSAINTPTPPEPSFFNDAFNFHDAPSTPTFTLDPSTGKMIQTGTNQGTMWDSTGGKTLQGGYAIGMDLRNAYMANQQLNAMKSHYKAQEKLAKANYGLSALAYNNKINDKQDALEAARQSGYHVVNNHVADKAPVTL